MVVTVLVTGPVPDTTSTRNSSSSRSDASNIGPVLGAPVREAVPVLAFQRKAVPVLTGPIKAVPVLAVPARRSRCN